MSDKVIIASFGKTRTARTATQFQYNHGQKLQFENVDLPANYEVHFSNSVNGEAKTRMGDSTGVVIPPEYFIPGSTIYAWIYITDEDSGITIRKVEIPISVKARPTDQPLEPEDESLVEQVVNRLNETIEEIPNKIDQALEEAKESGEFNGPKGDPFTYDDFTPEQLEGLKGPKGDSFVYDDFTPEQLEGLKGPKGDSFVYDDFTPEELEELTGPQGPEGSTIWTTNTPYSYSQETGRYYFAASNLRGPTNATKKLHDLVYLSDDTNKEYKAFYIVEFQYGGLQVGCRYLADMQGPPGEGATGAVLYDQIQTLTDGQKQQARSNIGAASIADIGVVFRLKGSVQTINDLPSIGNRVGDVYFVTSESVGYVWLEHSVPGHGMQGYWEKLGESINIDNLPNTIYWFAGTVDANDHFTPDEYFNAQMLVMAINGNRLPIIALSFPDGNIIKLPLLHYSFTNSANDYFVFYTVTSNPSKARLQLIKPLPEFYRISYYKELTIGGTLAWRIKYDHGYLVESKTIGDLNDLNTTDKSSIVNAINEKGAYSKPSSGIPKTDLASAVQTSLGKADTALQNHQSLAAYRTAQAQDVIDQQQNTAIAAKYTKPAGGIPASDLAAGVIPTVPSKPMLVTLSYTGSGDTYTADKTYAEIKDAIAAGREVLVDWGPSILRSSESGFTWIGYDDGQILEFILREDSSWIGIITDLGMYRTAADQDTIDRQQNTAIAAKYTKPSGGIPKSDLAAAVQTSLGKADTALQTAPVSSVNGQTGAVTVPEPFFVTYSTSDMTTWTCDKTFAQITAAMVAGKQVVMIGSVGGVPIAQSCDTMLADYGTRLDFWIRYGRNGWYHIIHKDDDSIEFYDAYIDSKDLDAVASNQGTSEAGKFLVVGNDGNVTTMTLSTWSAGSY